MINNYRANQFEMSFCFVLLFGFQVFHSNNMFFFNVSLFFVVSHRIHFKWQRNITDYVCKMYNILSCKMCEQTMLSQIYKYYWFTGYQWFWRISVVKEIVQDGLHGVLYLVQCHALYWLGHILFMALAMKRFHTPKNMYQKIR